MADAGSGNSRCSARRNSSLPLARWIISLDERGPLERRVADGRSARHARSWQCTRARGVSRARTRCRSVCCRALRSDPCRRVCRRPRARRRRRSRHTAAIAAARRRAPMSTARKPARRFFVAGTDTEIGKTHVACALLRAARQRGHRVAAIKPIAAGAEATAAGLRNEDALALLAASRGLPADTVFPTEEYEEVNPYCFSAPVSPHIAAAEAGVEVDLTRIRDLAEQVAAKNDWLVVEGAGGWRAPLSLTTSMAELAVALGAPVLLVVGVRLGCLNHAALTAEAIRRSGLPWLGWVANHIDPQMLRVADNLAMLERLLGSAPLGVFPHDRVGEATSAVGLDAFDRLAAAIEHVSKLR
ncbi:MAG: dethiobiotin synthase [Sinobacteraceae bacterium]|nr:dethiobiotin synthase [Nevskiaceae bacterium]